MANPGAKYVSVNLNKSYGRQNYPPQQSHFQHFNGGGGSYGQAAASGAGRGRTGSADGGGMVVLSRNRGAAPKIVPKLSVPPPLNLPSLRKEHEKFDMSGSGGGLSGGPGTGGGRPTSSGMGWTKPIASTAALTEKNESHVEAHGVAGKDTMDGVNRGTGSYMPPSARSNGAGLVSSASASRDFASSVGKSMVLRGEDFPSLQDARPNSSGASQKQKDGLNHKQKQVTCEEPIQDKRDSYHLGPTIDVHPLVQPSGNAVGNVGKDGERYGVGSERRSDHIQKQKEFFPDPLPLVRLNPRSDWADDERDTGIGFMERRGRDSGYLKSDNYWDRDYDLSKPSVLPHKTPQFHYDNRRGQRDNETGKSSYSSEVPKMDPYSMELRAPSREGEVNKWRASPFPKDGTSSQDVTSGSRMAAYGNVVNDNKYIPPYHGDTGRDGNNTPYRDSTYGNRGTGQHVGRQQWNNFTESYTNREPDRNFPNNRHVGDNFQNNTLSRSSLAASGKVPPITEPILNIISRDKLFSKSEKPLSEDSFARDIAGYNERDPFSGGLVGVIKRKKDAAKSTDFHDPVRESFEAELERVQKMQELERQRIIEEQERALEQAQREEEDRLRRITEEEERQRRLEEEAREAAWRAEQERSEAIRKAEELKIAREEEKRRIQLEEERRKQAAKQKLLELEAKMAKKQAEAPKDDVFPSSAVVDAKLDAPMKEKELDMWEDNERMVEKVTAAPFNSFAPNRSVEMCSWPPYPPREGSSIFIDSGKSISSWRRDVFENSGGFPPPSLNHEMGHHNSPRRDAFGGGNRTGLRKDFHVGPAPNMSSRSYSKEGVQRDLYVDEFGKYNREMDSEFPDNRYDDYAWSQGHSRLNARPPFPEQLYPNPESNELYSYGRSSRYSVKQPRVLPPPLASAQRANNFRGFDDTPYMNTARSEATRQTGFVVPVQQETTTIEDDQKFNNDTSRRCDSPSSLSVSSPPASPPHLSHDELDESGDSRVTSAVEDGKRSLLTTGSEIKTTTILNENSGKGISVHSAADSISAIEDEEWILENDDRLQLQEEYDEDEGGYREEEEVREVDDELNQKYQGLELEEKDLENVVLGFDEGVEVIMPSDKSSNKNLEIPKEREEVRAPSDEQNVPPVSVGVDSSFGNADLPAQHQTVSSSSSGDITGSVGVISLPPLSAAAVDTTPVKLQFGLFSGPTLIPSPVPAIQIGSIQMPLHIHAPIGPPVTHVRPSQPPPPLFQFGQLHYTSPISLPMAPPQSSFSFGNPNNMQQGNNVNNRDQNNAGGSSLPHQPAQNVTNDALASHESNKQQNVVSAFAPLEKSNGNADNGKKVELESGSKAAAQVKRLQYNVTTGEKSYFNDQRSQGTFPGGNRGRRFTYSVKNSNTRSYPQAHDNMPGADSNGYQRIGRRTVQRTEFRVRENNDRRQAPLFGSSNNSNSGLDDNNNSNFMGKGVGFFTRRGSKRGTVSNRTMKQRTEFEPSSSVSQELNAGGDRSGKETAKSSSGETNLWRNVSEEDVVAPLQSGVVRVFKQSGIEAPSDDDDFIEVRSKRQMLNDRREQREKEIKAKSITTKPPPRKQHFTRQSDVPSRSHNKVAVPSHSGESNNSKLDHTTSGSSLSQTVAPIGTLVVNSERQLNKPSHAGPSIVSSSATKSVPMFQTENNVKDHVQPSSSTWSSTATTQQVMSLTQTQLDEAMKPVKCDSHLSTDGGHSGTVSEPTSVLPKDKSFSSSGASPINSLLAGEKIQFGAVTSPTVLTPSTRTVSHGIGAPGSNRPDVQISRNFENDGSIFFGKEKHSNEACDEAEAEAAASAVAVAAISSDEIIHTADIDGITKGVVGDQQLASQSQGDESLTVSLPADLSVETTPISLWPPLPSPLSSSGQMLSHFPGGPHSHFPFYEMNPMLGGPIYTFSPHEESSIAQSQAQKSTASTSGPVGNWHKAHSGVESYYGPPAGFPGPFVGPPGGIPGVNAPPHMVVYNHFAPVGQYGQVGLSFMGTTYIPSGKQADWKHTPNSSALHITEGDVNSIGMNNVQRTAPNMTSAIQHLAPGSPLLPMGSPLPMFDVSPFQTAPDMSMQARWAHIPPPPLHSIPSSSRPLHYHPQVEGDPLHSQVNHSLDQPLPVNRYPTSSSENAPSGVTNVAPYSAELVLQDPLRSNTVSSAQSVVAQSSSATASSESGNNNGKSQKAAQFSNKNAPGHQGNSSGYNYQRGGMNRGNMGNEWSHRRMGFHGRSQSGGVEKGFPASKVKQIYVAKTTTKASSTN